jgi:hypothetical protein
MSTQSSLRSLRGLAAVIVVAAGLGIGYTFKMAGAATPASASPEAEPAPVPDTPASPAQPAPDIGPPPPAELAFNTHWNLEFGLVFEVPVAWIAKQSNRMDIVGKGPAIPSFLTSKRGEGHELEGVELTMENRFDVFRVDPRDLRQRIEAAQQIEGVNAPPRCSLRPTFDATGLLEYRQVFGHLEGRAAIEGNYTGKRTRFPDGALSLEVRGVLWDRNSFPPQWEDGAGDGGILDIVESAQGDALLRFRPEDGRRARVVGNLSPDGSLALWVEEER